MLKKMYEIYYDIIYGIGKSKENNENTSESIDKIIKDDIILNSDFEMDLLNLMSDIKIKKDKQSYPSIHIGVNLSLINQFQYKRQVHHQQMHQLNRK